MTTAVHLTSSWRHTAANSVALLGVVILLVGAQAHAQVATGTIHNATTGTASANDVVILLENGQERTRTESNAEGRFSIDVRSDKDRPRDQILRVIHGGVSYDRHVSSDANLDITVYESSADVNGLTGYLSIVQFQSRGDVLEVTELVSVRNKSNPPTTQINPHNFEVVLPEGAQIESATVGTPTGESVRVVLDAVREHPGRYQILFPLMPGLTRYVIAYQMPYNGKLIYRRSTQYSTEQFSLMLPSAMNVVPLGARRFQRILNQKGTQIQVYGPLAVGEKIAFELSGAGTMVRYLAPSTGPPPSLGSLPQPILTQTMVAKKTLPITASHDVKVWRNSGRAALGISAVALLAGLYFAFSWRKTTRSKARAS